MPIIVSITPEALETGHYTHGGKLAKACPMHPYVMAGSESLAVPISEATERRGQSYATRYVGSVCMTCGTWLTRNGH
ncbi:MAG: hypothetical protein HYS81_05050 [Candidatus Aenigmatarchaeota archaeon]|nr:MAG: hypothetical protein HYS81_05050 [Candidatus Aenigmarchaeota archaeon]